MKKRLNLKNYLYMIFFVFSVYYFFHSLHPFDYFFVIKLSLFLCCFIKIFTCYFRIKFSFLFDVQHQFLSRFRKLKKNVFFKFCFCNQILCILHEFYNQQSLNTHLLSFCQDHFVLSFSLLLMHRQKLFT